MIQIYHLYIISYIYIAKYVRHILCVHKHVSYIYNIDTEYDLFANLIESYQAISIRFESNLDTSIQSMYSSLLHYSKFSNPGTGLSWVFSISETVKHMKVVLLQ